MNLTNLENQVLNKIVCQCGVDKAYASTTKSLSVATGLSKDTIKGVIGSLVKKGKVLCEKRELVDRKGNPRIRFEYFAKDEDKVLSFGEWN